ncbi:IMP dehydrogenase [Micromonospora globispora]|uniref:IMP dehydrogenase n=2 Tax=Micromonospora globispora TaxID=1450148 RepID=A0A317K361_9ACTN|nr:zinc-dependent alcohol dehydrogenase family protein [Micromonospora globispora]PWU47366.1 IMP dehydrogenase [Micromonospora globispora]PWU62279.1 IMP dehydrogenase [Micromonospora globispora]RQX07589.1 IMP dehydrogenase [Micromonospora globispora]
MRATLFGGPGDITVGERPDPRLETPTDAVVRVTLGCVCGSDLWYYRGVNPHALGPIGHEFIGVVEQVGADVTTLRPGDLVVAPFTYCDGTCANCAAGWTGNCLHGGSFGNHGIDGGQGEFVRVPYADATLVKVPGGGHSDTTLKSLLALSDVMCTGHHAAVSAGIEPGATVAVVGDGAVGLCAVIAAKRLGADRIIALSRNPTRQALAREFGATDIVIERGDDVTKLIMDMTGGLGVDAALECVGTGQSMATAFSIARVGSIVGAIGVPHDSVVPIDTVIFRNVGLRGGVAPARRYIPELLDDVLAGRVNPGLVFDYETDLDGIADAYTAMIERRATKSLVRISAGQ